MAGADWTSPNDRGPHVHQRPTWAVNREGPHLEACMYRGFCSDQGGEGYRCHTLTDTEFTSLAGYYAATR